MPISKDNYSHKLSQHIKRSKRIALWINFHSRLSSAAQRQSKKATKQGNPHFSLSHQLLLRMRKRASRKKPIPQRITLFHPLSIKINLQRKKRESSELARSYHGAAMYRRCTQELQLLMSTLNSRKGLVRTRRTCKWKSS